DQDRLVHDVDAAITSQDITAHAATLPADHITLTFLTPTRLKHNKRWVRQGPPFDALVKTLLGRISSLSYFHCGQRFETDFRGLIDRAASVRIAQNETRWEDWSRFSGRQKQRVRMGGLVGQVTYEGELRDYLPLLALGEWVHVGKGAVFGNGKYEVGSRE
ncbi:MAG: CRISPR system precrRNA processing endoribonuclease RAMP protein Cas6, partial [Anaerolineae bacterium]